MKKEISNKKITVFLIIGIIGCILMGAGDWLMIYGNTSYGGNLSWLTIGVAEIEPWRNSLAMFLSFPAVIFYSIALFAIKHFFTDGSAGKIYTSLTAVGLTPWLCIHLLYVVIMYVFSWLFQNGRTELSYKTAEALFEQFSWIIPVGEIIMILPFIYFLIAIILEYTVFPRWMALNNPLIIFMIMKGITVFMNNDAFKLAFTNGLMSESMLIFFIILIIGGVKYHRSRGFF